MISEKPRQDVEVAAERGDVLRHVTELLVERHEAQHWRRDVLDERDERRHEAAVGLADKDIDEVVAPASSGSRLHPERSPPTSVELRRLKTVSRHGWKILGHKLCSRG